MYAVSKSGRRHRRRVRGHLVGVEARVGRGLQSLASADENNVLGSAFDAAVMKAMQALGMSQERLEFLG